MIKKIITLANLLISFNPLISIEKNHKISIEENHKISIEEKSIKENHKIFTTIDMITNKRSKMNKKDFFFSDGYIAVTAKDETSKNLKPKFNIHFSFTKKLKNKPIFISLDFDKHILSLKESTILDNDEEIKNETKKLIQKIFPNKNINVFESNINFYMDLEDESLLSFLDVILIYFLKNNYIQ